MKNKRFLAIFLVLTMLVSLMPVGFAADEDVVEEELVIEEAEEVVREETPAEEPAEEPVPDGDPYVIEEPEEELNRDVINNPPTVTFVAGDFEDASGSYAAQVTTVTEEVGGTTVQKFYVSNTELAKAKAAVTRTGYTFSKWDTDVDEAHAFVRPEGNALTVTAVWDVNKFDVTYAKDPADLDVTLPTNETVANNTAVSYKGSPVVKVGASDPNLTVAGYTFDGFYIGNTKYATLEAIRAVQITDVTEITLKWVINGYNVTFDYNGADANTETTPHNIVGTPAEGTDDVTVNKDYKAVLTSDNGTGAGDYNAAPIKTGYTFVKWAAPEGKTYTVNSPVEENETFTATWTINEYTVNYMKADGDDWTIDHSEKVEYLKTPAGYEPAEIAGQDFSGWSLTAPTAEQPAPAIVNLENFTMNAGNVDVDIAHPEKPVVFYPVYGVQTRQVTFKLNGGSAPAETEGDPYAAQTVTYGKTANKPVDPEKFGYDFDGWTVPDPDNPGQVKAFDFGTEITENTELTASWVANEYRIRLLRGGIDDNVDVYYGDAVTPFKNPVEKFTYGVDGAVSFDVKAITAHGYTFDGYTYVDNDGNTVAVSVGTLALSSDMKLEKVKDHTYRLTLTPVITSKFWEVTFVTTNGEAPEAQQIVYWSDPAQQYNLKAVEPEGMDSTTRLNGKYLDGWQYVPHEGEQPENWNFATDVVADLTLTANWLVEDEITFNLRNGTFSAVGETGKRYIPRGKTFQYMFELASRNTAELQINHLNPSDYTLPEATRDDWGAMTWVYDANVAAPRAINYDEDTFDGATTLEDLWDSTTYTVYYKLLTADHTAKLTDVASESVKNGATVKTKSDPVKPAEVFVGWFVGTVDTDPAADAPQFKFNETKVTADTYLYAKFAPAAAHIGTVPYATLDAAVAAAKDGDVIELYSDIALTQDISVEKNVTFKFAENKVTGEEFTVSASEGKTLTIESGSFQGGVFAGTVDLKGGTFLGTSFAGATLTTFGGKYDTLAARPINVEQLADSDHILAVVNADGRYTYVPKQTLTFDFDQEGVEDIAIVIGVGETPEHAIDEHAALYLGFKPATILAPTAPEGVKAVFNKWTIGEGEEVADFDLTAAYNGEDATVTAVWDVEVTVTFSIYGEVPADPESPGLGYVSWTQKLASGDKAVEPYYAEKITKHNLTAVYQDEFECWEDADHNEVSLATPITADTALYARMKAKIILDYKDSTHNPLFNVIQAKHGDKLGAYKNTIENYKPVTADNWVDLEGNVLNYSQEIYEDLTFVPLYATKDVWSVYEHSPEIGFSYVASQDTAGGTIIFKYSTTGEGADVTPIVMDAENTNLELTIEAPSNVLESDGYEVKFDGGSWMAIQPQGTVGASATWDGRSLSNNPIITVVESLTLDQIKSATGTRDEDKHIDYKFQFRKSGVEDETKWVTFDVKFYPSDVVFQNYDNDLGLFAIINGEFEYKLTLDTNGGSPATIPEVTVEYGTSVALPEDAPTKDDWTFNGWSDRGVGDNEHVYWPGESVIIIDNLALIAKWVQIPVGVSISNGQSAIWDAETYYLNSPIRSISETVGEKTYYPEKDDEVEGMTFTGWKYLSVEGEEDVWKVFEGSKETWRANTLGTIATGDAETGYRVDLVAQYEDSNWTLTFITPDAEPMFITSVKDWDKTNVDALVAKPAKISDIYTGANKTAIDAAAAAVEGFQYWTLVEPNEDGWAKAPEKFDLESATATIDEDITLYAYNPVALTVSFDANGVDIAIPSQTVAYGEFATEPDALDWPGHDFLGWFAEGQTSAFEFATTPIYDNVLLTALWDTNQYKVTFYEEDGETVISEEELAFGTEIVAPQAPEVEGKTFKEWNPAVDETVPANDVSYTAVYEPNLYKVTFFEEDGETVISEEELAFEAEITAPEAPEVEGKTFKAWDPEVPETVPAEDVSFTAVYEGDEYTVTFYEEDGKTEISSEKMKFGEAIEAPAAPEVRGKTFKEWNPAVPETVPAEDVSFTAVYEINKFTVKYLNPNGEKPIVKEDVPYDSGVEVIKLTEEQEATVVAPANYHLYGWTLDVPAEGDAWVLTENPVKEPEVIDFSGETIGFIVTSDLNFYPVFVRNDMAAFKSFNLELKDKIVVRAKMIISDELMTSGYSVVFGDDFLTVPFSAGESLGENEYFFYCPVPIADYNKAVGVSIVDAEGNKVPFIRNKTQEVVESMPYSVATYVENNRNTQNEKLKAVVLALEQYGLAAENKWRGGNNAVTVDVPEWDKVTGYEKSGTKPDGIERVTKSGVFEEDITLNLKYYLASGKKMGDYDFSNTRGVAGTESGQNVTFAITKLKAKELSDPISFVVSPKGDAANSYTETVSIMAYAKSLYSKDSTDAATRDVLNAMYWYNVAAVAYFA